MPFFNSSHRQHEDFLIFENVLGKSVCGCKIIVLDDKEDVSDDEELTRDVMALLASFSGKYYGRRSLKRRKQNKK